MCGFCIIFKFELNKDNYFSLKHFNSKLNINSGINLNSTLNLEDNKVKLNNTLEDKKYNTLNKEDKGYFLKLIKLLKNRGPDFQKSILYSIDKTKHNYKNIDEDKLSKFINIKQLLDFIESNNSNSKLFNAFITSSVLSMRGEFVTQQPLMSNNGNLLMYNGNINCLDANINIDLSMISKEFTSKIKKSIITDFIINNKNKLLSHNDTDILFELLNLFSNEYNLEYENNIDSIQDNTKYINEFYNIIYRLPKSNSDNIVEAIDSDHSFLFIDKLNNKIIINKDLFGKRSLIFYYDIELKCIIISSLLCKEFQINVDNNKSLSNIYFEIPANSSMLIDLTNKEINVYNNPIISKPSLIRFNSNNINNLNIKLDSIIETKLYNSIKRRLSNYFTYHNSVSILFSGGVDSLLIAYISTKLYPDKIINLINLAFYKSIKDVNTNTHLLTLKAPDRQSGLIAYYELLTITNHQNLELVLVDVDVNNIFNSNNFKENNNEDYKMSILELIYPNNSHMDFNISTALKLSTKLQGIKLNKKEFIKVFGIYIEKSECNLNLKNHSIINDKNTKTDSSNINTKDNYIKKPDYSNDILSKKLPDLISFIESYYNIKAKEEHNNKIRYLYDDNQANLLYYKPISKLILSGLGADEFLGGYARYRTAYNKDIESNYTKTYNTEKNKFLIEEMSKDIDRVWNRNFGRDDRAISDNGIEMRFPFFDIELINLLSFYDVLDSCDFSLQRGVGEKRVLRQLLYNKFGCKISWNFEKRAIQFGTSLAKETNKDKYGSNRKANGKAQYS